jgi:hypothetical protein
VPIGTARRVHFHQRAAAGIEIDDPRVLDEPGSDHVEQADLRKQPQGFGVVGDRARQPEQPRISLENDNLDASSAKEIGEHQADRTCANDRDLNAIRQR